MRIYYYIAIAVLIVGAGGITAWQFVSVRSEPAQAASTAGKPAGAGTASGNPLMTIDRPTLSLIIQQCGADLFMVDQPDTHTRHRCVYVIQERAKERLGVLLSANDIDNPQLKARWLRLHDVTDAQRRLADRASKGGQ